MILVKIYNSFQNQNLVVQEPENEPKERNISRILMTGDLFVIVLLFLMTNNINNLMKYNIFI